MVGIGSSVGVPQPVDISPPVADSPVEDPKQAATPVRDVPQPGNKESFEEARRKQGGDELPSGEITSLAERMQKDMDWALEEQHNLHHRAGDVLEGLDDLVPGGTPFMPPLPARGEHIDQEGLYDEMLKKEI